MAGSELGPAMEQELRNRSKEASEYKFDELSGETNGARDDEAIKSSRKTYGRTLDGRGKLLSAMHRRSLFASLFIQHGANSRVFEI